MADVFSKRKRSSVMRAVRGSANKSTELRLISFFRAQGISGWRRGLPLFGKPDFVFRASKLAVFVDGCFWHGCPKHGTQPASNARFWRRKIAKNQARDKEVTLALRRKGWRVMRIWEHELKRKNERRLLSRFKRVGLLE